MSINKNIKENITEVRPNVWEIPSNFKREMKVPGRFYLEEDALSSLEEGAIEQITNVACLPGIQKFAIGLPDIHFGYGFPIGGVGAFSTRTGVISPGGVGFDINCGVRMVRTNLTEKDIKPKMKEIVDKLFVNVPSGVGSKGKIRLKNNEIDNVLDFGAEWAVENEYGWEEDLNFLEENGRMLDADSSKVSEKAKKRGIPQLGSLGSGNHFLEVQKINEIFNEEVAKTFNLEPGTITIMVHSGSRGCGHQVCSDHLRAMDKAYKKHNLNIPDRQLACAPIDSIEAENYFRAMSAAANYAWANRQMMVHWVRETFEGIFNQSAEDMEMSVIYDVAHNIAKKEVHNIKNRNQEVIVHRKGATRAFGPGRVEIPSEYRKVGQPILIPGTMGTASYILHGTDIAMEETFGSTAHGAGRKLSRTGAKKKFTSDEIKADLKSKGIHVRANSDPVLAEEAPAAYKDVDQVVRTSDSTGIAKIVAKVVPLAVTKG
ncbi:tRNA-splicing ligase [Methanobrevibacter arboriphilus JCM 13429 = DSM 1125]|uniref:tRNA-splicing ligase RtcB n=1 Tax=Methanobrevibacter arboriphilus JCM 13429 = DSM 1125 TaxID=1300164 RepID=A0A1V6N578_METAZ|nr:RtcB family protein [Methanobrevibacter arboriphilus]OQD59743.1 tRNA-splicing ligase [Methanobrevibacter arboriphilus JCM 13429 = DSM 1125]